MQVNVHEAKTQLSRLIELVKDGERVIIAHHGRSVTELIPVHQKESFPFDIARQSQLVPPGDAWWQPLSEKEVEN